MLWPGTIQTTQGLRTKAVSALMWTTSLLAHAGPQPCRQLSISLPGQHERDRCQLASVCFKPFPCRQNRAAGSSCPFLPDHWFHQKGFAVRWLRRGRGGLSEEGSVRKAALPREKGSSAQPEPGLQQHALLVRKRGYL